jgi:hypothetical protein
MSLETTPLDMKVLFAQVPKAIYPPLKKQEKKLNRVISARPTVELHPSMPGK